MTVAQRQAILDQLLVVVTELEKLTGQGVKVRVDHLATRRCTRPRAELVVRLPERIEGQPLPKYIPREGR